MLLVDNPTSPYAAKVRITLYEKGLDPKKLEIRTRDQREEIARRNPRVEVPALEDGDLRIYDSSVICDYLEERHPDPPLLPADAGARARCRLLERFSDGTLDACLFALGTLKIFHADVGKAHPEALSRAEATLRAHFAGLEEQLGGAEHFLGAFSRADVALIPHFAIAAFLGYRPGPEHPGLAAWAQRVGERPSVKRANAEGLAAFQEDQKLDDPLFSADRMHVRDHRIEWLIRFGLGPWLLDGVGEDRIFFSLAP